MNNRGRFQAQGKSLDESEKWAQEEPLYIDDGLIKLSKLKEKLKPKDLRLRVTAFKDCEDFINKLSENGGIDVSKFPNKASWSWVVMKEERVDLEVHKGVAFKKKNKND